MISKSLALKVLNEGLSTGADFVEIYIEETNTNTIEMDNGKVKTINSGISFGAGIRLLKGLQSVYGYTNDVSLKGLKKLAHTLAASYTGEPILTVSRIEKVRVKKHHQPKIPLSDVSKDEKIALMKEANDACSSYDSRIVRTRVTLLDNTKKVTIFNSNGKEFHDERSRGRIAILAVASENGVIETSFVGPGAQKGLEFFKDDIDVKALAVETAKTALTMLHAEECPSGKMTVVIGNGFGGVIFHEACGHGLEATSVSKELSIFSNKLGQKIASDIVNAVDDGTIEGGWGSGNIDDEGIPTHRTVLIENGILKNYLIDSFNGRRMHMEGNGATRRESYQFEPTSRMSNTFLLPGKETPEEIIAETEYGLYAKSLGGGSVNPTTGDFNFAVTEGYLIENGKVTRPVKSATLIGNGADILMKIDRIGNDLERAQGMCGSASGSIPVDVGQPTIRVQDITVGGRGGKQ